MTSLTVTTMSRKYSLYLHELEQIEKVSYRWKLKKFGGVDNPFVQEPTIVGGEFEQLD